MAFSYRGLPIKQRDALALHIAIKSLYSDEASYSEDGMPPFNMVEHGTINTRILLSMDFDGMNAGDIADLRQRMAMVIGTEEHSSSFRKLIHGDKDTEARISEHGIVRMLELSDSEFITEVKQTIGRSIAWEQAKAEGRVIVDTIMNASTDALSASTAFSADPGLKLLKSAFGAVEGGYLMLSQDLTKEEIKDMSIEDTIVSLIPVVSTVVGIVEGVDTLEHNFSEISPGPNVALTPPSPARDLSAKDELYIRSESHSR